MKRAVRMSVIFVVLALAVSLLMPVFALAAEAPVDVTNANDGYVTVDYDASVRMKVGIKFNNVTTYYEYVPGAPANYALIKGDGYYTVTLYRNTTGTKYSKVSSVGVWVELTDDLAPYRVSTFDASFTEGDAVSEKAAELCAEAETDGEKVAAIYTYMSTNLVYNRELAADINSGKVTVYTPDPNSILESGRGICIDLASLFAAMCRSQGIAVRVVKGYNGNVTHSWTVVTVDGVEYQIDPTYGVGYKTVAKTIEACVSPLTYRAA